MRRITMLVAVVSFTASRSSAQDPLPSSVTFNLKRHFLEELASADCHIAAPRLLWRLGKMPPSPAPADTV